jgi:hypothetical protein
MPSIAEQIAQTAHSFLYAESTENMPNHAAALPRSCGARTTPYRQDCSVHEALSGFIAASMRAIDVIGPA